jgi:hypothetical protein
MDNPDRLDYIIANRNGLDKETLMRYAKQGQEAVEIDEEECKKYAPKAKIITAQLTHHLKRQHLIRHDEIKLAQTLLKLA